MLEDSGAVLGILVASQSLFGFQCEVTESRCLSNCIEHDEESSVGLRGIHCDRRAHGRCCNLPDQDEQIVPHRLSSLLSPLSAAAVRL